MIDPPDRSRRRRDRLEAGSRSHEEDVARSTQEPPRQTPGRPTPHLPCFDLVSHARPALVCEHELRTDNIFCQPPLDGRKRDVAIRFPGDPSTIARSTHNVNRVRSACRNDSSVDADVGTRLRKPYPDDRLPPLSRPRFSET